MIIYAFVCIFQTLAQCCVVVMVITRKVCVCVTLDGKERSVRWRKASVSIPPVPTMENVSTESVCVLLHSRAITASKVQLTHTHTHTLKTFIKTFSVFDGLDSFLRRKIELEAQITLIYIMTIMLSARACVHTELLVYLPSLFMMNVL